MKVQEIMATPAVSCGPDMDVAAVAKLMWDGDCGAVPIVGHDGKVAGVITDRDICMAVATRDRPARFITVREVMNGHLYACFPDDDVHVALETMASAQVHRLPVVDQAGILKGIVSMNDLALSANGKRGATSKDILATLQAISAHRELITPAP